MPAQTSPTQAKPVSTSTPPFSPTLSSLRDLPTEYSKYQHCAAPSIVLPTAIMETTPHAPLILHIRLTCKDVTLLLFFAYIYSFTPTSTYHSMLFRQGLRVRLASNGSISQRRGKAPCRYQNFLPKPTMSSPPFPYTRWVGVPIHSSPLPLTGRFPGTCSVGVCQQLRHILRRPWS